MPGINVSNKAIGDLVVGIGWLLGEKLSVEEAMKRAL